MLPDATTLTAYAAAFNVVALILLQIYNVRRTARKDDLVTLSNRVAELQQKLEDEALYVIQLLGHIGIISMIMRAAGLQVPDLPQRPKREDKTNN